MQTVIAAAGRVVLWLALLLCWNSALASSERPRRVAAVAVPAAFADALRVALSPWGIEVARVDEAVPQPEIGAAASAAAGLARQHDAALVLWVDVAAGDGAAWLWIYDAGTGQLAQRPLPAGPPTSAEPAAAAALTAKTMIRLSVVAPAPERFGARQVPAPRVHLEAGVELRPLLAGPTDERLLTQSVAVTAAVTDRLVLGASLTAGPGFAVDDSRLVARFTRTSVAATARYRVAAGSWWAIEPGAGLGVHFTSLDGAVPGAVEPVAEARTNVSVAAATSVVLRLGGGLELAATFGVDVPLRRQRYLLAGVPLLELPELEPLLGLQVRVPIH